MLITLVILKNSFPELVKLSKWQDKDKCPDSSLCWEMGSPGFWPLVKASLRVGQRPVRVTAGL
jgi:hypothetical protein